MTATTAPRFTAERIDGEWTVVKIDTTGRQGVGTYSSREQARQAARERNTSPIEKAKVHALDEDAKARLRAKRADRAQAAEDATPAPKVPATVRRVGTLREGERVTFRDVDGVVTVDRINKTGKGRVEVAYTTEAGEPGTRELWTSSRARVVSGEA